MVCDLYIPCLLPPQIHPQIHTDDDGGDEEHQSTPSGCPTPAPLHASPASPSSPRAANRRRGPLLFVIQPVPSATAAAPHRALTAPSHHSTPTSSTVSPLRTPSPVCRAPAAAGANFTGRREDPVLPYSSLLVCEGKLSTLLVLVTYYISGEFLPSCL